VIPYGMQVPVAVAVLLAQLLNLTFYLYDEIFSVFALIRMHYLLSAMACMQ